MKRITVLGAGRVGNAMVLDLARGGEFELLAADRSAMALARLRGVERVTTVEADLGRAEELRRVIEGADIVVGAVPGFMGFETVKTVIEAGKTIVDISFFPEDCFKLDGLARDRGVVAVVDCGVAPGCDNLIYGHLETKLESVERFECLVGGLPVVRSWPYEYKAPFSPSDVIEEYVRPARYVAHGQVVTLPALTEPELLEFAGVGTLEAFNTDGLRSLLFTGKAPFMKERTLRYPGHIEKMRVLRETGFFSTDMLDVAGVKVRPLDVASRLLFPLWHLQDDEEDFTVMRVEVQGVKGGRRLLHRFDMLDRYDPATRTPSMSRTTGYTCTAAVRMVAAGLYATPGISPPEYVGRTPGCYEFMFADLARRGVVFHETVADLGAG